MDVAFFRNGFLELVFWERLRTGGDDPDGLVRFVG